MATKPWKFIPDLLEEHIEELAFLWGMRKRVLRSHEFTGPRFRDLEDRIQGRIDGIRAVGPDAQELLQQKLASDDPFEIFAGAFPLLDRAIGADPDAIIAAFTSAQGPRLTGLAMALGHTPTDVTRAVAAARASKSAAVSVAALEILALRGARSLEPAELEPYLLHEDIEVRCSAWRVVSYASVPVRAELFAAALRDTDGALRAAALEAAGWCSIPGVLTLARQLATKSPKQHPEALQMLAILGGPEDLPLMTLIAQMDELGPRRYSALASYGSPMLLGYIIQDMEHRDPKVAQAAGNAFTKMTAANIDSQTTVDVPRAEDKPDDPLAEDFGEPVTLPDADAARRECARMADLWRSAGRLASGIDVSRPLDSAAFGSLDMQSRFECGLRAKFVGAWAGTAADLEVFPQRF